MNVQLKGALTTCAIALLAAPATATTITGYNINNTRLSSYGGWTRTYDGTVITIFPGPLADYVGGTGSMADGVVSTDASGTHLFNLTDLPTITFFSTPLQC